MFVITAATVEDYGPHVPCVYFNVKSQTHFSAAKRYNYLKCSALSSDDKTLDYYLADNFKTSEYVNLPLHG